jgi:hypothetical protein
LLLNFLVILKTECKLRKHQILLLICYWQWQWTPLGYAIHMNILEIVKTLLDKKADVEKTFVRGEKAKIFVAQLLFLEKKNSL